MLGNQNVTQRQAEEEEDWQAADFVPVSRLVRQVTLELIPALRAVPEAVQLADEERHFLTTRHRVALSAPWSAPTVTVRLQYFSVDVTVAYV